MGNPFERIANGPAREAAANPFGRVVLSAPTADAPAPAPTPQTNVAPKDVDELRREWWDSVRNAPDPSKVENAPDLADVPGQAASNFFPSIWNGIKNFAAAAKEHPLDTVLSMLPSKQHKLDMINTMWDRYGSWDAAKKTAAENPASMLTDLTALGAFAPETKIGRMLKYVDPAAATKLPGYAVEKAGQGTGKLAQVLTQSEQGINAGALKELFEGGEKVTPGVWSALTKGMDPADALGKLRTILSDLFEERHNDYVSGMNQVEGHATPIDFSKIDNAVGRAGNIGNYKAPGDRTPGPGYNYERDPTVKDARGKILAEIELFRQLGSKYHTAAGFDKLKQAVAQIGDSVRLPNGMPSRGSAFANTIGDAIIKTVKQEAPEYGRVMQMYSDSTNTIKQLMSEFSTGKPGQSPLPTLKKLQSVWRDHANLGYGARADFLKNVAERTGNGSLMEQLAANEYHPVLPRGLRGVGLGVELPLAAAHAVVSPATGLPHLGAALGAAAMMSPRLMGTAAYGAGRAAPYLRPLGRAYQDVVRPALPWAARDINDLQPPAEKRGGFFSGR